MVQKKARVDKPCGETAETLARTIKGIGIVAIILENWRARN